MHYALELEIRYDFDRPAGAGRQLLRVLPAPVPGRQILIDAQVSITPEPLEKRHFTDFFGTEVIELVMPAGLSEFRAHMHATVERPAIGSLPDLSPPLAALPDELARVQSVGPDSPHHFLAPSPHIPIVAAIADFAAQATAGAPSLRAAVTAFGQALHAHMTFDAEATDVDTPVAAAFAGRRGVCQDFAQIMVCGLRSLGIPAAYVAGYLRTLPPPGQPRLVGADAMHAWVRAWCGSVTGWFDYDATNACEVDADHLVVGFGRDYGDAAPVTGSFRLDGGQKGSHSVDIVAA